MTSYLTKDIQCSST